jgi:hypothetical protein
VRDRAAGRGQVLRQLRHRGGLIARFSQRFLSRLPP